MRLVAIASFPNRVQAGMAAGVLESRGIAHTIQGDDVGIFGPGFMGSTALGVRLLVPESLVSEAVEVLVDAGLMPGDVNLAALRNRMESRANTDDRSDEE